MKEFPYPPDAGLTKPVRSYEETMSVYPLLERHFLTGWMTAEAERRPTDDAERRARDDFVPPSAR